MTHLYFAAVQSSETLDGWDWDAEPMNLLVAFPVLQELSRAWRPRRIMLDSGAFTVWNTGGEIDLEELTRETMKPRWTESVSLDVIGDWRASKANAIRMKVLGSPAMPVFHVDDPWELLDFYCDNWPKVGLGGMVGRNGLMLQKWCAEVFKRAWPKKLHSFGMTDPRLLLRFPFHSADSSTWRTLERFGNAVWGDGRVTGAIRQVHFHRVPTEVHRAMRPLYIRRYLELERQAQARWGRELARLGA